MDLNMECEVSLEVQGSQFTDSAQNENVPIEVILPSLHQPEAQSEDIKMEEVEEHGRVDVSNARAAQGLVPGQVYNEATEPRPLQAESIAPFERALGLEEAGSMDEHLKFDEAEVREFEATGHQSSLAHASSHSPASIPASRSSSVSHHSNGSLKPRDGDPQEHWKGEQLVPASHASFALALDVSHFTPPQGPLHLARRCPCPQECFDLALGPPNTLAGNVDAPLEDCKRVVGSSTGTTAETRGSNTMLDEERNAVPGPGPSIATKVQTEDDMGIAVPATVARESNRPRGLWDDDRWNTPVDLSRDRELHPASTPNVVLLMNADEDAEYICVMARDWLDEEDEGNPRTVRDSTNRIASPGPTVIVVSDSEAEDEFSKIRYSNISSLVPVEGVVEVDQDGRPLTEAELVRVQLRNERIARRQDWAILQAQNQTLRDKLDRQIALTQRQAKITQKYREELGRGRQRSEDLGTSRVTIRRSARIENDDRRRKKELRALRRQQEQIDALYQAILNRN